MNEPETPQAINDRAIEWVARIDRDGDDRAVHAELEAWLAGDPRRRGAHFRARTAWAMLDRASVLGVGQGYQQSEETGRLSPLVELPSRRQLLWRSGAAAAGVAAVVLGLDVLLRPRERIETALGEIRRVPLKDGSFVTVNTQSDLEVRLKPAMRQIVMARGEAWFEVAKDHTRPFLVEAGDVRVRAVGTAFAVRRTDSGVSVQVTEGVVEVWRSGDAANKRRVSAGMRTFVDSANGPATPVAASEAIDRSLAWRDGELVFAGDSVADAAAEFNRYNTVKLEIADPDLAREKMVGRFRTNEPDAFARAAAGLLHARVVMRSNRIVVTRE